MQADYACRMPHTTIHHLTPCASKPHQLQLLSAGPLPLPPHETVPLYPGDGLQPSSLAACTHPISVTSCSLYFTTHQATSPITSHLSHYKSPLPFSHYKSRFPLQVASPITETPQLSFRPLFVAVVLCAGMHGSKMSSAGGLVHACKNSAIQCACWCGGTVGSQSRWT